MVRKRALWVSLLAGLALGTSLHWWPIATPPRAPAPTQVASLPVVPVTEVVVRKLAPTVEFTGTFAAVQAVELKPRVGGYIEAVSVPEGGLVEEDQLLFRIDPRRYSALLDAAEAQLNEAQVLLEQAEADVVRAETLVPKGAAPQKTLDDAIALRNARRAQLAAAQAAVASARLNLDHAQVTAPIAGRVSHVHVTEGNLVTGGDTAGSGATLLTTIVSVDTIHVTFDIDEATYLELAASARSGENATAAKLPVRVGLMTDEGYPHEGHLDFLGNQIDSGTGTIRARAVIPNPDGSLAPGLFARVELVTGEPRDVVLIDDEAVGSDQSGRYVLVLGDQNTVEQRTVRLGPVVEGLRLVTGGLSSGDRIVVKGLVRPGMQVTPRPVKNEIAAAAPDAAPVAAR